MNVGHAPRRAAWIACACALTGAALLAGCSGGGDAGERREEAVGQVDVGAPADGADTEADAGAKDVASTAGTSDAAEAIGSEAVADLAASVNGQPIPLADFQSQALEAQRYYVDKGLDPNTDAGQQQLLALRRDVLSDIVDQALIEQEAARRGITATNQEVEASLAGYRAAAGGANAFDDARATAGATDDEVFAMERQAIVGRKFVEALSHDLPTTAQFVHARHILCTTEADCSAALERLEAGEDFGTVAQEVSKDETSATTGGDLGWVPIIEGFTYLPSAELQAVIAGLQPGQRSAVVHTDYGYHVVEVTELDPARAVDDRLQLQMREKRVEDWLAEQRRQADIVIYIDDLKDSIGTSP